jgi:phosphatidylglycerophosphatase A
MVPMGQVKPFRGTAVWRMLASGLGAGHLPVAPGTAGSLLALPLWYLGGGGGPLHYGALAILLLLAVPAIRVEMRETGRKDPPTAVIDEAAGMLLAATGVPWGWPQVLILFALFRAFDIMKFGPAAWMDSREGAFYVVADDLVAGACANLVFRGGAWLIG